MNYGKVILLAKYFHLYNAIREANEEMIINPNEHSNRVITDLAPKLEDVKECLKDLGVDFEQ